MALTDIAIRNAKPGDKPVKLTDGAGMFLLITSAGGKLWRLKYRIDGREKLLALGAYPEITLSEARKRREEARQLIALGTDPSREKQKEKVKSRIQAENSFSAIAEEYCAKRRRDGDKGWAAATSMSLRHRSRDDGSDCFSAVSPIAIRRASPALSKAPAGPRRRLSR